MIQVNGVVNDCVEDLVLFFFFCEFWRFIRLTK